VFRKKNGEPLTRAVRKREARKITVTFIGVHKYKGKGGAESCVLFERRKKKESKPIRGKRPQGGERRGARKKKSQLPDPQYSILPWPGGKGGGGEKKK